MKPLFVELCAGTGVLSRAFEREGWESWRVDTDARHSPDFCADVRELVPWDFPRRPSFVWSSPPCVEFSRWGQPWTRKLCTAPPDLSIVRACVGLASAWGSCPWALESVRGALPWLRRELGAHIGSAGQSWYWWGSAPRLRVPLRGSPKQAKSSGAMVARASYSPAMVRAVVRAITRQLTFAF